MGFLEFIFGGRKRQVEKFINEGAIILDVRTQREWGQGHIENSIHIPLDQLRERLPEIKKLNKPVIAICESGVRSSKAAKFLNLNNITAINGGGWKSLNQIIAQ